MSNLSRNACYILGTITAVVVCLGAFSIALTLASLISDAAINQPDAPYTAHFFAGFTLINCIFLFLLAVSAIQILQLKLRGFSLIGVVLKLEILYFIAAGGLMFLPPPFGHSAGGAFGIGNMGLAPQAFIAFPITGLFALWLLRRFGIIKVERDVSSAT